MAQWKYCASPIESKISPDGFERNSMIMRRCNVFRRESNLLLAVDDETGFLELIQQIGEGVGCDVITADSGAGVSRPAFASSALADPARPADARHGRHRGAALHRTTGRHVGHSASERHGSARTRKRAAAGRVTRPAHARHVAEAGDARGHREPPEQASRVGPGPLRRRAAAGHRRARADRPLPAQAHTRSRAIGA